MSTARVRVLKDGVVIVGNRIHAAGDIVDVPSGETLDTMFQSRSAEYADPGTRTPTPDEIIKRRIDRANG